MLVWLVSATAYKYVNINIYCTMWAQSGKIQYLPTNFTQRLLQRRKNCSWVIYYVVWFEIASTTYWGLQLVYNFFVSSEISFMVVQVVFTLFCKTFSYLW